MKRALTPTVVLVLVGSLHTAGPVLAVETSVVRIGGTDGVLFGMQATTLIYTPPRHGALNLFAESAESNQINMFVSEKDAEGTWQLVARSYAGSDGTRVAADEIIVREGRRIRIDTGDGQSTDFSWDLGPNPCTVVGTPGDDTLRATGANDYVCGLGGDDTVLATSGADTFSGGSGTDTVSFVNSPVAISSSIDSHFLGGPGTGQNSGAGGGTAYVNIEDVTGSDYDDRISATESICETELGCYAEVDSVFVGGRGNDVLQGGNGADELFGWAGNDVLTPGSHGELADGGMGTDRLDLQYGSEVFGRCSSTVNLLQQTAVACTSGHAVVVNIEDVSGSSGNDDIRGDASPNTISGRGGDDTLYGYADDDFLYGRSGDDALDGGMGNDTCIQGAGTGPRVSCEN